MESAESPDHRAHTEVETKGRLRCRNGKSTLSSENVSSHRVSSNLGTGPRTLVQRLSARGHDDRTERDAEGDGQQVRTEARLVHADKQFIWWKALVEKISL